MAPRSNAHRGSIDEQRQKGEARCHGSFAGLWDRWKNSATGKPMTSCTIIVTDANALTRAGRRALTIRCGARPGTRSERNQTNFDR